MPRCYTLKVIVRVHIFGELARELSCKAITVDVMSPAKVRDVNLALVVKHPMKAQFFQTARLAVNHAFSSPDTPVQSSDEVALIELVGGG